MNHVQRDKCYMRRMVRAGCVDAVGVVRARHMDSTRPQTNAERVSAWRNRSHAPGFGGYYVRPWKSKRAPVADCPQPDGREIDPRDVVQFMPVSDHEPPAIPQEIETGHPMPAAATPRESPSRAAAAGFNHKEPN
ncbi:MAG TPA: hypothetical protein VFK15_03775 [Burkholderiales bacterium]|nr:hypothetical protein [Burkholderiales bacterium]